MNGEVEEDDLEEDKPEEEEEPAQKKEGACSSLVCNGIQNQAQVSKHAGRGQMGLCLTSAPPSSCLPPGFFLVGNRIAC